MAPAKFDDLCKPAKDVLTDDYQEKGYAFKAKSKTNFEGLGAFVGDSDGKSGGIITTAIDLDLGKPDVKSGAFTPAKLTWKFPKPLAIAGLAFDKLEMDKAGKTKLEASMDKGLHGVDGFKLECKSELDSLYNLKLGATYTGIKDAFLKAEFKAVSPAEEYTAEAAYDVGGGASLALKSTNKSTLDVGARYSSGPFTGSVTSKGLLTKSSPSFTLHGFYKVADELKMAATYETTGDFSAGLGYTAAPGTFLKAKFSGVKGTDFAVSASLKRELAKGATMTVGVKVPVDGTQAWTKGVAFNIE